MNHSIEQSIEWKIPLASIIIGFIVCCNSNNLNHLNEAIIEYKQKGSVSIEIIESAFTKLAAFELVNKKELIINEKVIYAINQDRLTIYAPIQRIIHLPAQFPSDNLMVSISEKYAAVSDGKLLHIFSEKGELGHSLIIGDEKYLIRDILIEKSIVYIYKDHTMYACDIDTDSVSPLNKALLMPPYGKLNHCSMKISGKYICLITGIAGVYSIAIIDIPKKRAVIKNLSATSNRVFTLSDSIIYIEGGAANWSIVAHGFEKKGKSKYNFFSDIVDIHLAKEGYILENSKGKYFGAYGERPTAFPFNMKIIGVYGSVFLIESNNQYFIAPTEKVFKYMKILKLQMPELFFYGNL